MIIQQQQTTSGHVYIVDDEPNCRTAIARIVACFGYEVVEFESAEEFLRFKRVDTSACAIVDYRLTGMNGIDMQSALRSAGDDLPLIFLTGYAETHLVVEAMRDGAVTLLEKPVRAEVLQNALTEAFTTQPIVSRKQRMEPSNQSLQTARLIRELSPREREVADLVASGYSNRKIAAELGLSEKTIEKYRSNCVRKLHVNSSAEMVRAIVTAEILGIC